MQYQVHSKTSSDLAVRGHIELDPMLGSGYCYQQTGFLALFPLTVGLTEAPGETFSCPPQPA
jgi:hypothetical protein